MRFSFAILQKFPTGREVYYTNSIDEFQFLHVDSVHRDVYIVEEEYGFIYHRRIVAKQWISSGESLYRGKSKIVSLNRPRGSPVHIYFVNPVLLSHIYYV